MALTVARYDVARPGADGDDTKKDGELALVAMAPFLCGVVVGAVVVGAVVPFLCSCWCSGSFPWTAFIKRLAQEEEPPTEDEDEDRDEDECSPCERTTTKGCHKATTTIYVFDGVLQEALTAAASKSLKYHDSLLCRQFKGPGPKQAHTFILCRHCRKKYA